MEFKDFFRLMRGLSKQEKRNLEELALYLNRGEITDIRRLLKQKKIMLSVSRFNIIKLEYPKLTTNAKEIMPFVQNINSKIKEKIKEKTFNEFSKSAFESIQSYVAPNIVGLDSAKEAAVLQLFAPDHVHLLLLGDPGTGKTDILRSINQLAPLSSFGLGSGTSGAGLAVSVKGNEVTEGLLPMANKGICCIDELNLLKEENRASLYNAMEKGFITYDKSGKHYKFNAKVSIIATANPKGDKFTGKTIKELKKQLPFDSALLTRFHLSFFIRKPDSKKFSEIAKKIIKGKKFEMNEEDTAFVKEYIGFANALDDVDVPQSIQKEIVDFGDELKKKEDKYLVEISPRFIVGILRLVKASARIELRKEANEGDFERVKKIMLESLKL